MTKMYIAPSTDSPMTTPNSQVYIFLREDRCPCSNLVPSLNVISVVKRIDIISGVVKLRRFNLTVLLGVAFLSVTPLLPRAKSDHMN